MFESYAMDNKIIKFLIQDIVETGDYTLEGIAYHTHIPFDVIYDLACGINTPLSITPWVKIVQLYLQARPEISKMFIDSMSNKNNIVISSYLNT